MREQRLHPLGPLPQRRVALHRSEVKGLVERANGYLATGFLPGRASTGPDERRAVDAAWPQGAERRRRTRASRR